MKQTKSKAKPTKQVNNSPTVEVEFSLGMNLFTIDVPMVPRLFELVTIHSEERGVVEGRVKDVSWRYGTFDGPRARVRLGKVTLPTHD